MENNDQNIVDYANMMPDYSYNNPYDFRVGFGRRLGAYIIDYLIYSLVFAIVLIVTGRGDEFLDAMGSAGTIDYTELSRIASSIAPLALTISIIYYSLEAFIGATLGKLTLGIKIASSDRTEAPIAKLLIRFAVKNINTLIAIVGLMIPAISFVGTITGTIVFIGFFFILNRKKQGFHDLAADTAVFYKEDILKPQIGEL
ncbi:MAG TPA: RDD family protein [Candidatus Kapabacteria bacterium]|nr:RDD family protein [Candidatus Kapabacteria bacterium]